MLFLDHSGVEAIRARIGTFPWARALWQRVRRHAERPFRTGSTANNDLWEAGRIVRDKALADAISGEPRHAEEIAAALAWAFETDRMSQPPTRAEDFSYVLFRGGFLWAYDLSEISRPIRGRLRTRLEQRFADVLQIKAKKVGGLPAWRLGNCDLWDVTTVGLLGFLLREKAGIAIGVGGFKQALGRLKDGLLWPEATAYGHKYVSCCLLLLAEAARHAGGEDLHGYTTPSGSSLKSLYDGFLRLLFADGRLAGCGDYSTQASVVSRREQHTSHDHHDSFLYNNRAYRQTHTYEIAYARYRDPAYAWLLARNPARDHWDHTFWGYAALTHGETLGRMRAPPARSRVFSQYGAALLRSDETGGYWRSAAPAVFVRTGAGACQNHGHDDHFGLVLNAFGVTLYPDWFIQWDYQPPRGRDGRPRNPSRYSRLAAGHNTLVVDGREPLRETVVADGILSPPRVRFLPLARTWPMVSLGLRGLAAPSVTVTRWLGLTPDYLVDVFRTESRRPHRYDYVLRSCGAVITSAGRCSRPYPILGEEFGLGRIDEEAASRDNRWIRRARVAATSQPWQACFRSESHGVRIFAAAAPATEVFSADTPAYVSAYGWDDAPMDGLRRHMPLLIVRRRAASAMFLFVHQPFQGHPPAMEVSFTRAGVRIGGKGFSDTVTLTSAGLTCHRK